MNSDLGKISILVLLHFTAAFDTVEHTVLLEDRVGYYLWSTTRVNTWPPSVQPIHAAMKPDFSLMQTIIVFNGRTIVHTLYQLI